MKVVIVIILIIVFGACIYLLLGDFGLLPKSFYKSCQDIDVETAMKRGCCEDRPKLHPVSWLFGEDNCDRYREEQDANLKQNEKGGG